MPKLKIIISLLMFSYLWIAAPPANAQEMIEVDPVTLTTKAEIREAKALSANLGAISRQIMACMETGKENLQCQCDHLEQLHSFRQELEKTLENHPDWKDQVIYYEKQNEDGDTVGVSTSFIGLQKQSEMIDALECN